MGKTLRQRILAAAIAGAIVPLAACSVIVGTPLAAEIPSADSTDGGDETMRGFDGDVDTGSDGSLGSSGSDSDADSSGSDGVDGHDGSVPSHPDGDATGSLDDASGLIGGEPGELYLALPAELDPPEGWTRSPVYCSVNAEERSAQHVGGVWLSFAYPANWEYMSSSGNSDSPQFGKDRSTVLTSPDANWTIDVEHRWADVMPTVRGDEFELATGLHGDKIIVYDENSEELEIPFDPVTTVEVGDQQVGLFVAAETDHPDWVTGSTFRALVIVLGTPTMGTNQARSIQAVAINMVVEPEITDADAQAEAAQTAATLLSSLTMPECTLRHLVVEWEAVQGQDLDGDGYISDTDDWKALLDVYAG